MYKTLNDAMIKALKGKVEIEGPEGNKDSFGIPYLHVNVELECPADDRWDVIQHTVDLFVASLMGVVRDNNLVVWGKQPTWTVSEVGGVNRLALSAKLTARTVNFAEEYIV